MKRSLEQVLDVLLRAPSSLLWESSIECVDAFWLGCGTVFPSAGEIVGDAERACGPEVARFRSIFDEARFRGEDEASSTRWLLEQLRRSASTGAADENLVEYSLDGVLGEPERSAPSAPFHPALLYWAWDHSATLRVSLARRIEVLGALHRGYVWAVEAAGVSAMVLRFELERFAEFLSQIGGVGGRSVRFWEQVAMMRNVVGSEERMKIVVSAYWWWLNEVYSVRSVGGPSVDPAGYARAMKLVERHRADLRAVQGFEWWRGRLLEVPSVVAFDLSQV